MKIQPTEWWEVVSNHISSKRLVIRIYKEVFQLNNGKTNNPILKWENNINRYFYQEDIQKINKYMKRCSTWLAIREMQIKTTVKYHFTPIWLKSQMITNEVKDLEKLEFSYISGENANGTSHFGKQFGCSSTTESYHVCVLSHIQLFMTPLTIYSLQAPLSMEFSRQEDWSRLPFPFPRDLPDPGVEPQSPALQADSLPSEPQI